MHIYLLVRFPENNIRQVALLSNEVHLILFISAQAAWMGEGEEYGGKIANT